ncbi:mitochondrial carrier [Dacryopinax primogenitus]|uniref:Mitochondrial carrier n=1 Tax=Dacryopinax primogenitus (strain DJM 731) TaxID=1858805 RepID=M5GF65_DACPD|nr:mitochondrial carrier [Dacryopinax primogenitus]EJU03883.1 mitochondrial carrier [Dacryopinax primogenitus]
MSFPTDPREEKSITHAALGDGDVGKTTLPQWRLLMNEYLAGTVGGMAGLVVGYPFDTVKVRLQNPETAGKYTHGIWSTFGRIVAEERFLGLFKGIASPMATLAPLNGLVFGGYGYFLRLQSSASGQVPTLWQVTVAGTLTGIAASTITAPTELIKIRQQTLISTGIPSTWSVVRTIYSKHGIPGLYRGITATVLRDAGYGPYFLAYELTTRLSPSSPVTPLFAGAIAGIIGWTATFPLDVLKTRIQSFDADGSGPYRSTWSTAVHSWQEEGWGVFWRGLWPTVVRAVPVNMATFGAFELALRYLA